MNEGDKFGKNIKLFADCHCELSESPMWNKKVFASGCFPDGIAMDINGNLWVTDCRQGRPLLCYNPQGEVIDEIYFPVYRIISVAFGGEDNSTMFVTTSGGNSPKGNYDGGVFMIENIATGAEEFILKGM